MKHRETHFFYFSKIKNDPGQPTNHTLNGIRVKGLETNPQTDDGSDDFRLHEQAEVRAFILVPYSI